MIAMNRSVRPLLWIASLTASHMGNLPSQFGQGVTAKPWFCFLQVRRALKGWGVLELGADPRGHHGIARLGRTRRQHEQADAPARYRPPVDPRARRAGRPVPAKPVPHREMGAGRGGPGAGACACGRRSRVGGCSRHPRQPPGRLSFLVGRAACWPGSTSPVLQAIVPGHSSLRPQA
jgi:hypothetical protein